jgi:hypothetical protein
MVEIDQVVSFLFVYGKQVVPAERRTRREIVEHAFR